MSELEAIRSVVSGTATRQRLLRGWRGLWRGFLVGALVYLAVLAVYKLLPIPPRAVSIAMWLGLAALPVGFLWGWRKQVTEPEAARWLDQKQRLQERLSTALEFADESKPESWRQLLVTDAASAAGKLEPRRLLPWSLPSVARWVALALAVTAGLGFIPEFRSKEFLQRKKDAAVIKETGQQLALLTRRNLTQHKPALEPTKKSIENVAELGERLQQAKLTRGDALKDLASATDKLKQELNELGKNPALRKLEKTARNPSGSTSQSSAALQKQIEAMQKALGDKQGDQKDALDQLQKDLQKLKDAAKGLADKDPSAASAAARAQMSQAAAELARKAEAMGLPMPSLDEAVAALNAAQVEQFLKDLNLADRDLQKMAEMAKSLAQLQQQAEKLGKDLAEQLKNGQAQAAIESLQKMIEQLQAGKISPEDLNKMIAELDKALDPAKPYGKVPDHLKNALSQCKGGNKPGAGQSLAAAQKELQDLLEQMGDMQGLMASLDSLQKAQMCVGNGMSWGQCTSMKTGFNPNGKRGGRGVGAWADDNPWAMPDRIDDLWDNSGVNRPDMAGRGHTDRNSGTPDNLSPTKIKGQMQPGAPMPSITLRGVSIKGQSSVGYTEAATAAQTDAQSALSQEQVPRAYQNAVRDYFDDLKK